MNKPYRKYWPLAGDRIKFPVEGAPGSFAEDRGDRYHCGMDIYAPAGTKVLAIESGVVIDSGVFTSGEGNIYWNTTYFIAVKTIKGPVIKYAELGEIYPAKGEIVSAGTSLGAVGTVLARDLIDKSAPEYIQKLKEARKTSMLHLEIYRGNEYKLRNYKGGNLFESRLPECLIDPAEYLADAVVR
ncbi:MAG: M23 family metallopeptidase [Candidatus Kapaibacterium sp.]